MAKSTIERSAMKLEGGQYSTLAQYLLSGVDYDDGLMLLQASQEERERLVKLAGAALTAAYYDSLFESPATVLETVRQWNAEDGHCFSEADFVDAWHRAPAKPTRPLVGAVLVPYCKDSVGEQFEYALSKAAPGFRMLDRVQQMLSDERHLRLHEGITMPRLCLRWEIIDFGANLNRAPGLVQNFNSPHAGVLFALAQHRRWATQIGARRVTSFWAPGYDLRFDREKDWGAAMFIHCDRYERTPGLANEYGKANDGGRLLVNVLPNSRIIEWGVSVPEIVSVS